MDYSAQVTAAVTEMLTQTGFKDTVDITVSFDEAEALYNISLQTETPAPLIGYHGDTLSALQSMLGQHLHAQIGEWLNLTINVNDYRERREASLKAMTEAAVEKVVTTGQAYSLPPLPASERRLIHMFLAEHGQVMTESVGEGRGRSVVISPKQ